MTIPTRRLDALNQTMNAQRDHEVAAMRDGISNKLRVEQILALLESNDIPDGAVTLEKLAAAARSASGHAFDDTIAALGLDPADRNVQKAIEVVASRTGPQPFTDVASATTTDVGAVDSLNVRITGTVTIEGLGTAPEGVERRALFAASLTLTHNATSLILPGGDDIVTAAGDVAVFVSLGSGNWRCVDYSLAGIAPIYIDRGTAKAFGNLNGSGTIALRDSLGISSATDKGAGDYKLSLSTAFSDANFNVTTNGGNVTGIRACSFPGSEAPTASSYAFYGAANNATAQSDVDYLNTAAHGDLA